MEDTELLPAPLRRQSPANTAEALEAIAHAQALTGWVKDLEAEHRAYLDGQADVVESATGGAYNVPVNGVGRVQRTDPDPVVRISDPAAYRTWAATHLPDTAPRPYSTEQVELVSMGQQDQDDVAEVLALVRDAQEGHRNLSAADQLLRILACALRVTSEWVVLEDHLPPLTSHPQAKVDAERRAVLWADPDTGEQTPVPGVTVTPSRRDLRVTIDKDAKARLRQELETIIGPPALEGPTDPRRDT